MSLTLIIIIITGLVSYQALNDRSLSEKLKHYPYVESRNKEYYRMLTGGFVHGNMTHLLINMFVLYSFGEYVEARFLGEFGELKGRLFYLFLYLGSIIVADIGTYFQHKDNPRFASVGASGATSAILLVFVIYNPWATLLLFFVIPCPAIIAAVGYLIYSSWASKNSNDMIDHSAHFYGAVFGIIFIFVSKPDMLPIFLDSVQHIPYF